MLKENELILFNPKELFILVKTIFKIGFSKKKDIKEDE